MSDLNGENRRNLLQEDFIQKVVGLTVFDDYLYVIDKNVNGIRRVKLNTVISTSEVLNVQSRYMKDIHSVKPLDLTKINSHPCIKGRLDCSHICIASTHVSKRCLCPKNYAIQTDERTCRKRATCLPDEFACASGGTVCIPKQWRCDGASECEDESDEINCGIDSSEPICNATQYLCSYGQCPGAKYQSLFTTAIGPTKRKQKNNSTGLHLYCGEYVT